MAEPGGSQENGSEQGDAPPLRMADVAAYLNQEFGPALVDVLDRRLADHSEATASRVQDLVGQSIAEVREQFGISKAEAQRLLAVADKVLDPEELATADGRAEKAALEARLKQLEQAKNEPPPKQPSAPENPLAGHYVGVVGPHLREKAVEQGLVRTPSDWAQIERNHLPREVPMRADGSPNWPAYIRDSEKAINKLADEAAASEGESRNRTRTDTLRPAGSGRAMTWEQAQKTTRMLTPDEVFALTGD